MYVYGLMHLVDFAKYYNAFIILVKKLNKPNQRRSWLLSLQLRQIVFVVIVCMT